MYNISMKVFIFSRQREIAQVITDHLSDKGHLCFSFYKLENLREIIEKTDNWPDLLVLDYLTFNHAMFDIYHFFERHKYHIPIVYYNEPCLIADTRTDHWLIQINYKQNYYLKLDLETLRPVLAELEELIEAPEFKPYVSLLQEPKPLPKTLIHDQLTLRYIKENENDCIYDFRNNIKLQPSLFYLLEILQRNKSQPMSLSEILQIYKRDRKQMTEKSLKVIICRLRSKIRENPDCGFLINFSDNKYRFVRYKI